MCMYRLRVNHTDWNMYRIFYEGMERSLNKRKRGENNKWNIAMLVMWTHNNGVCIATE